MGNYKKKAEFVKKYLDKNDWHYDMHDHGHVATFSGGVGGFKGVYNFSRFAVIVDDDAVQNYATYPASAKDKIPQVAEFIARANFGLKYGAFEMDYSDREVRFHLAFPMSAVRADEDLLPIMLGIPPKMLDESAKGFTEVIMGLKTPEEAIKDCEG